MSVREIRIMGDPVLRQKAADVAQIEPETRILISDMFETMYDAEGVGLAAPQIGISQRIIVVDPRDDTTKPFALVNPVIVESSEDLERGEEGCLSIPGLKDIVERPERVIVEGYNDEGSPTRVDADGLLARILQHEIDHLNGVLFIDRLSPLKRKMLLQKWKKTRPDGDT
jgi:peptide deformylase